MAFVYNFNSWSDQYDRWIQEANAYDNDLGNASAGLAPESNSTGYLTLLLPSPVMANGFGIKFMWLGTLYAAVIDVLVSGPTWQNVRFGTVAAFSWTAYDFTPRMVSGIRINVLNYDVPSAPSPYAFVYELQLRVNDISIPVFDHHYKQLRSA